MKKLFIGIGIGMVGVIALAFGAASIASAQTPNPDFPGGYGPGEYGPRGPMSGGGYGDGVMHDYMVQNLADALGISVEDFESRVADGETFFTIAQDLGWSLEDARQAFSEARIAAMEQAVADGVIPQDMLDWHKQRAQEWGDGERPFGPGYRGNRGSGNCWFDNQDGE